MRLIYTDATRTTVRIEQNNGTVVFAKAGSEILDRIVRDAIPTDETGKLLGQAPPIENFNVPIGR
jgi:hypothetical protein